MAQDKQKQAEDPIEVARTLIDRPKKERRSFEVLTPESEEYQRISKEVAVFEAYKAIAERENRLLRRADFIAIGERIDYHHNTVRRRYNRYMEHGKDGLRNLDPGFVAGKELTDEQWIVLQAACLKRQWVVEKKDDIEFVVIRVADVDDVYDAVMEVPNGHSVSKPTIKRLMDRFISEHQSEFVYAHEGRSGYNKKRAPKKQNNVPGPNYRWQYDFRCGPIYVLNGNISSRVIFGVILDDFSQNPLSVIAIARKEEEIEYIDNKKYKKFRRVSFTATDASRQLCNTMFVHKVRPLYLYTDRDPIFADEFQTNLVQLISKGETPIAHIKSLPGEPQGRGKIERFLGLLDEILREFPGYLDKDDWEHQRQVLEKPLWTLDYFRKRLAEEIEKRRDTPPRKNGAQTRRQLWESDKQWMLPAPPDERLALFANTFLQTTARVYPIGVLHDNIYYVPKEVSREGDKAWDEAVGLEIPFRLAVFSDGSEEKIVAAASYNEKTWTPIIPRELDDRTRDPHLHIRNKRNQELRRVKRIHIAAFDAIMAQQRGDEESIDQFAAPPLTQGESDSPDTNETPPNSSVTQSENAYNTATTRVSDERSEIDSPLQEGPPIDAAGTKAEASQSEVNQSEQHTRSSYSDRLKQRFGQKR
jgi:hypothetical protein